MDRASTTVVGITRALLGLDEACCGALDAYVNDDSAPAVSAPAPGLPEPRGRLLVVNKALRTVAKGVFWMLSVAMFAILGLTLSLGFLVHCICAEAASRATSVSIRAFHFLHAPGHG